MVYIQDILARFISVIRSINLVDVLDMLIMAYLMYKGYKLVRETRAQQLVKGIILLCILYFIIKQLELKIMGFLLENFFQVGIIAIIVMFQPELRRVLEKMGRTNVKNFGVFSSSDSGKSPEASWENAISEICEAAAELSETTTGALIVIERQTRLGEQIATGTVLNCDISSEVLGNIFYPKAPLHDGAVIIRDAKILAAGCFLPKPQKEELINKQLGSRHRAAIGMSEVSDAIVVIVSEETGTVSIAESGELSRGYDKSKLEAFLRSRLIPEKASEDKLDKAKKGLRRWIK